MKTEALLIKHSEEITQLKIASSQMMMLWKIVGGVALIALGAYLSQVVK